MLSRLRPASRAVSRSRLLALSGIRPIPDVHVAQQIDRSFSHGVDDRRGFSPALTVLPPIRVYGRTLSSSSTRWSSKPEGEGSSSNAESSQEEGSETQKPEAEAEAGEEQASEGGAETGDDPKEVEIVALKERVLRAYADMENMRDRLLRENSQMKLFAVQGFAKGLLDVADNLARAASTAAAVFDEDKETPSADAMKKHLKGLLEGVQATERQLLKVFKTHGLEKYSPMGEAFDPNRHEAMFQVDDPSKDAGTVIQVLKDGYLIHGRVLRAAEVGVTTKPE